MRILLCPSAYAPHVGGVEELTYRLAYEYQNQGHTVEVVTQLWPLDLPKSETIKDITVRRIDYAMPGSRLRNVVRFVLLFPLTLFRLTWIIRRFHPDVVHIQCVSGQGLYVWLLKSLLRFKLVVTLQGERLMDADKLYQRSRIMNPILGRLLHAADYVTACSQATLDNVNDLCPPDKAKAVVWNGISLNEFDEVDSTIEALISRSYIFATGRHVDNKGFDILIDAFSRIAARYPNVDLIIGGDGSSHAALQTQITEYNLSERVHLPGYLNRTQTVASFRQCLFFILPSRYEPFGIVNLEAMAAAKAVIAANTGGVAEIVLPGETGLLVPPDDAAALAEAIGMLLDTPDYAAKMGQAGRARVISNFTWPQIAAEYVQIYKKITHRKAV